MHKNMKDEKAIIAVYIFIMTVLLIYYIFEKPLQIYSFIES